MYVKKFLIAGAAAAALGLTGCSQGAPQDGDPVVIRDAKVVGPWKSDVMVAGPNGMEYKPVYTPRSYYASVEYGGSVYDVPVTGKCFNSIRSGERTTVGDLKTTCGDSLPSLMRPVPRF